MKGRKEYFFEQGETQRLDVMQTRMQSVPDPERQRFCTARGLIAIELFLYFFLGPIVNG